MMPQAAVFNTQGEEVGQLELDPGWFDVEPNLDLMHQALLYLDNQRAQLRGKALTRAEVSRSNIKFGRQKGLGRARHGSRKAPTFVGGGKAHGPRRLRSKLRMPQKMRRKALACALTAQLRKGLVRLVADLCPERISTREMVATLERLRCSRGKILAVVAEQEYYDERLARSCRNVPGFVLRPAPHFNLRDVLVADHLILTQGALARLSGGGE